jgi:hypothetical protein
MIYFFADSCYQLDSYGSLFEGIWKDYHFYGYHVCWDMLDIIGVSVGR